MAPFRKRHYKIFLLVLLPILLFFQIQSVHAAILDDFFKDIKNFINPGNLSIDSGITLAPGGDAANNGEIDTGDIVRFSYAITNTSDKTYAFTTVKTNIDRKQVNFIHNVQGTSGIIDDGETISIPNVRLDSSQSLEITFDARINYYQDNDRIISTESEFLDSDKKLIAKSSKKEVTARKINPDKINSILNEKQQNSE